MKRSEHFNVVAGKYLDSFPLSVNGLKYVIYGVDSSHIFVDECNRMIYEARKVFIDKQSHRELYVVDKGDGWRSYWVEDSYVIGANCCTIRSISDFLREKNKFFCGDIVSKYDGGVPASRLCSATWIVMVRLLIAIPTRGCIVFLKRLRLSIGFPVDSCIMQKAIRCVPFLMS